MGCAGLGLAFVLALAVPASIARASLVGADVVIALLAAGAASVVLVRARRRVADPDDPARSARTSMFAILVVAVAYVALVTVIHVG